MDIVSRNLRYAHGIAGLPTTTLEISFANSAWPSKDGAIMNIIVA